MTFFEKLLLGHLVGDYLLQNNWMAQRKGSSITPCIVHCLIYTAAVCAFTSFSPWWALVVFLSHFPIDRFGLADKWLRLIRGRALTEYLSVGHMGVPASFEEVSERENYIRLRGGFTALVYAIADNTMHFLVMVAGREVLVRLGLL